MNIKLSKIKVTVGPERKPLFRVPSLEIKSGEKVLLKGTSGQGKSTFLHLLSGLFTPNEGSVVIGETELTKLSDNERALFRRQRIGLVFQKLNLIEHLTPLENIELSLRGAHDTQTSLQALASVGLAGREQDRVSVLSLGEQQRVAIARVLAGDHDLVFADEPTSSLDEKNALEVMDLLSKACAKKTLIVVSHDRRIDSYFSKIMDFGEFTG